MSEEQRFVLEARHGINGHAPTSLQRSADSMGCTREWVRQLEHRALLRARNILASKPFRI
jgi:DNA-directed RNA polymerase sigma subunit (sigma70/sigma32)